MGERTRPNHVDTRFPSRQERRKQARLTEKNQKTGPTHSRRRVIEGILVGAVAGLGGTAIYNAVEPSGHPPSQVVTPTADTNIQPPEFPAGNVNQDIATIATHLREINAEPNPTEITLLNQLYPPEIEVIPNNVDSQVKIVDQRIRSVEGYMSQSTLPRFKEAFETLRVHTQHDNLFVNTDPFVPDVAPWQLMKTTSQINPKTHVLEEVIHVDMAKVIAGSSGLVLALSLVRENYNVDSRVQFFKKLDSKLNLPQKLHAIDQFEKDNQLTEAAGAYADQAQATIDALATGIPELLPKEIINLAASYVRCNLDKANPEWLKYISSLTSNSSATTV